jgi:hypothetical protein
MTDPQKDEHIEELLSKLQGIFGKLSHSEEEEAKQKIEISSPAPQEVPQKESPPPAPEAPAAPVKSAAPMPINLYTEAPAAPPETPVAAPPPVAPQPSAASPLEGTSAYESTVSLGDPERVIIPSAVFFPPGRETEAKALAQKLETMTPKFTKVSFRLRVGVFMPYDPKSDWKQTIIQKAAQSQFQTVFVVMDRALEDSKRKAIAGELEATNIYFQEVTLASIEKKAFYTDILLGLVFFFDSRKPKSDAEGTAA